MWGLRNRNPTEPVLYFSVTGTVGEDMKPLTKMSEAERQGFFLWLSRRLSRLLGGDPTGRVQYALVVVGHDGPPKCIGTGDRTNLARLLRETADTIDAASRVSLSGIVRLSPPPRPTPDPESRIGRAMRGLHPCM